MRTIYGIDATCHNGVTAHSLHDLYLFSVGYIGLDTKIVCVTCLARVGPSQPSQGRREDNRGPTWLDDTRATDGTLCAESTRIQACRISGKDAIETPLRLIVSLPYVLGKRSTLHPKVNISPLARSPLSPLAPVKNSGLVQTSVSCVISQNMFRIVSWAFCFVFVSRFARQLALKMARVFVFLYLGAKASSKRAYG